MFDTYVTVIGNLASDLTRRSVGTSEVVNFRLASNARRQLPDGSWEDYHTLFVNVSCWDRLVTGVAASLKKGDPVIAVGSIHTREYVTNEGVPKTVVEMRASSVGPNLRFCVAGPQRLSNPAEPQPYSGPQSHAGYPDREPPEDDVPEDEADGRYDDGYPGEETDPERQPLSA
ncbi:single-stranded DNA-binding protein [Mycolicibacterium brumae]|uniref:Single-stranded DNA-binding protein n=1 Tax=Mycolicibacterium brumae TaxID=85968 RepID=A0A2G5PBP2_9MYCO|nr:single-stranded DNA-binding protein [Mycolicibacterium brumae]MCV7191441.1 single-stranded DNA-binding protein [Mycolicibacterium brumae]PIB75745.1 single-stranded DNA-binding protein [Mycolicibacterium brumae]RWA16153.1 hypothetical protein MBRU_08575 [Mycolicibacterium brumae DSM 44177]UWW09451.1 single-stranded DNA-binding protein [Mycolicibacterium brumae]